MLIRDKKINNSEYDVFISYSHEDKRWVRGVLQPMIESWQLKYAIDHQDFIPGMSLIGTVHELITKSKHVVFVCTKNFIDSEWCQGEVNKACSQDPGSIKQKAIPVVLEESGVPELLEDTIWCNLFPERHKEIEWQKLCKALNGEWSAASERILAAQNDLSMFLGDMNDNSVETTILVRSHSISEIEGVSNVLSAESAKGLSRIYSFLTEVGKTKKIKLVLSDGGGHLSDHFEENTPKNMIILGGTSQGNRVLNRVSKSLIRYKQNSETPKYCYEINGELFVPNQDRMTFVVYKSRTQVKNTVLFLFSPWPYANGLAAMFFAENFWKFVNQEREKEFLNIYEVENEDSEPVLIYPQQ